ncbi:MAG: LPD38 domain-containing protein [Candidatus Coprovivens sp.]
MVDITQAINAYNDRYSSNNISSAYSTSTTSQNTTTTEDRNWFERLGATALKTLGSVATGLGKGIEGIVDFGATLIGQSDWAKKDITEQVLQTNKWWGSDFAYDNTATNFLYGIGQSVGFMLPSIIAGVASGGTTALAQGVSLTTFGLGAAGGSTEEALREGANTSNALLYGTLKGGVEVATELIGGKIIGKAFGSSGKVFGVIGQNATEATTKGIIKTTLKDMAEEGLEEVLSSLADPLLRKTYKDGTYSEFFKENGGFQGLLNDFISGATLSGILQGGGAVISKISGKTKSQQLVDNVKEINALNNQAKELFMQGKNAEAEQLTKERNKKVFEAQEQIIDIANEYEETTTQQKISDSIKEIQYTQQKYEDLSKGNYVETPQQVEFKTYDSGVSSDLSLSSENIIDDISRKYTKEYDSVYNQLSNNSEEFNKLIERNKKRKNPKSIEELRGEFNNNIKQNMAINEVDKYIGNENTFNNSLWKMSEEQATNTLNNLKQIYKGKTKTEAYNNAVKKLNNYIQAKRTINSQLEQKAKLELQDKNKEREINKIKKDFGKKGFDSISKALEKGKITQDVADSLTSYFNQRQTELAEAEPEITHSIEQEKARETVKSSIHNLNMYWFNAQSGLENDIARSLNIPNGRYIGEVYVQQVRSSAEKAYSLFNNGWIDPQNKTQITKSFKDIVSTLQTQQEFIDFERYLYNMHNIDRMTIEDRFKPKVRKDIKSTNNKINEIEKDIDSKSKTLKDYNNILNNLNQSYEIESDKNKPQIKKQIDSYTKEINSLNTQIDNNKTKLKELKSTLKNLENRLKNITNKPVFGEDYTAQYSKAEIEKMFTDNPKYAEMFPEMANEIYKIYDFMLEQNVNSGRLSQDEYNTMKEYYPHYVPTYRDTNPQSLTGINSKLNTIDVKSMKKAIGSDKSLLSIDINMRRYLLQNEKANAFNQIGNALNVGSSTSESLDLMDLDEKLNSFEQDTLTKDTDFNVKEGKINGTYEMTFLVNGQRQSIMISKDSYIGLNDLRKKLDVAESINDPVSKTLNKVMNIFKSSVTSWNPFFTIRNFVRDVQDAIVYTKYGTARYTKNLAKSINNIKSNGEYYKLYKQYGGLTGSQFDFDNSTMLSLPDNVFNENGTVNKKGLLEFIKNNKFSTTMESVNKVVEIVPRLAEFISSVEVQSKTGTIDYNRAVYDAQEVTINFGKHGAGRISRWLNSCMIPFFNANLQGLAKVGKAFSSPNGFKAKASLIIKCAVLGLVPAIVNKMLYNDDEDYESLTNYEKDNFYLMKIGGNFVKIPKGRLIGLIGSFSNQNDKSLEDNITSIWEAFSPVANLRTIISPINDVKTNTTWYGSQLVGTQYQNVRPSQQYDEDTSYISRYLGKLFDYSPLKIDYLLEQYTGVVGDFILPMTSEGGLTDIGSNITSSIKNQFLIDPVSKNGNSSRFYDYKQEITYQSTEGSLQAKAELKYLNKISNSISEIYDTIDEIESDSTLSNKDKTSQIKVLKGSINTLYNQAIETSKKLRSVLDSMDITEDNYDDSYKIALYNTIGAESALKMLDTTAYERATNLNSCGIDYNKYFAYYYYCKGMNKDYKTEFIDNLGLNDNQKYLMYLINGYTIPESKKISLKNFIKNSQMDEEYKNKLIAKLVK